MPDKPIDEVLEQVKVLINDVKTIKNDVKVIKDRLHEINKARILREQREAENISKGWGWW